MGQCEYCGGKTSGQQRAHAVCTDRWLQRIEDHVCCKCGEGPTMAPSPYCGSCDGASEYNGYAGRVFA